MVTNSVNYSDGVSVLVAGGVAKDGQPASGSMSFYMTAATSTVLNSTALSLYLNVEAFNFRNGAIFDGQSNTIFFSIDTLVGSPVPDTEGDGVPDDVDQCPNCDLSATVVIDECNSGVTTTVL